MRLPAAPGFALLAFLAALGCSRETPRHGLPGLGLLARSEARLARERAALHPMLDHYALLYPIEQDDLHAFMRRIRFHGEGADLSLGVDYAPESHGGGLLRMLFDLWRPGGRAPRLDDRYRFESNGGDLALERLYRAYQQQLVWPGAQVEPRLPRMHFRFGLAGGPVRDVELDAYKFLGLLLALETDRARTWTNRAGQSLSVDALMRGVLAHYLASAAPRVDPADHSNLHLVELLVAWGVDLEAVQQHFLAEDLAPRALEPADASLLLSHTAESLGRLLEAPPLGWSDAARGQVTRWLAALEREHFRDVAAEDLESLCHLTVGLRAVRAHQAKLD
jgi:hypothetical protein